MKCNKSKSQVLVVSLVIALALLAAERTQAAGDLRLYVNGSIMSFSSLNQGPYINSEGRTMVPVRYVSRALGASVVWSEQEKAVYIRQGTKDITLRIGDRKARVGNNEVDLDTAATLTNNRTMVPLRFVSECLGAGVEWKEAKREIHIYTPEYAADAACINSDLAIEVPPPGDNPYNVNLSVCISYRYDTPVEPQIADLRKLLEKRFGDKAEEIIVYVAAKKDTDTILLRKDWHIDGKYIRVGDAVGYVTVTIWNDED